ncbi:cyclin-T1-3-like isoform X1 [Amaranthus tricolor]|uniref:cyclin-T1-3-like isoform X1 n=2 Tax=Amaranthus tricolor TaxID=29722 RepID=UPI002582A8AA|nr:cyclin-T1-3-like isoform X1 [Amaranthus tricolor]XP_057534904.1 cyclin-T1-3-like isoform X1 [Amaranthus tricolor]
MASLVSGDSSHFGVSELSRVSQEKPEDGGRWYFSRKEIEENSPSRHDGIDLKKETYLRKSYCTFLQDLGMRLKVPQVTIATAIIFCHRFYLRQSHAKNDRRTIATACMFLAGKVEETPRPLKDVIVVSYDITHKKDPAAVQKIKQKEVYEQQKELILLGERVVLATLGFDLNVQHPYKPLVEAIKKFKVAQNALAQVAWNFVNDGLRTSLCLQFKPHHIAAGAIFLAAKFLKVKLPSDGDKVWWQEFDVTPRQLEEVSNQMLELYEQNRAPPNQVSEAEGSVAGSAANRPTSRTSTEEQVPNSNSSHAGVATKPGTLKPPSSQQLPDHSNKQSVPPRGSHNRINDYGNSDHKAHGELRAVEPSVYQENPVEGQNMKNGPEWNSSEDSKEKTNVGNRAKEGDSKDKYHGNNVESKEVGQTQSPSEIIEKIDTNKLKELREKRRKSRADVVRKKDSMDEYDPIMKELEEGVELAAAESEKMKQEKKQNWTQPSTRLDNDGTHNSKLLETPGDRHPMCSKGQQSHGLDLENVEEGELSALEDSSWDYQSPKSNDRKRKAGSPLDKTSDGKRWRDSMPGDFSEEKSRMGRLGYPDRDHKRHVPENHV